MQKEKSHRLAVAGDGNSLVVSKVRAKSRRRHGWSDNNSSMNYQAVDGGAWGKSIERQASFCKGPFPLPCADSDLRSSAVRLLLSR
jgi:hypothetical protein